MTDDVKADAATAETSATTTDATQDTAKADNAKTTDNIKTAMSDSDKTADTAKADTQADWRKELAGEDEKFYKQLGRYASKEAFGKAHKELTQKISAGELRSPLKEGATEAEIAEWRKNNGIPETADKYAMPDGLVIGEEDKPEIDAFLAKAHKANASPEFVKTAVASFMEMREAKLAEISERDETHQLQTIDEMKQEWGQDYKTNMNVISSMLESAPDGLGDSILKARMPDGRLVGNSPEAARWLAGLARELNPAATVVPSGAEASMASVESEMKALEAKMGTKSYTDADRARYLKLTEAKMKSSKAA